MLDLFSNPIIFPIALVIGGLIIAAIRLSKGKSPEKKKTLSNPYAGTKPAPAPVTPGNGHNGNGHKTGAAIADRVMTTAERSLVRMNFTPVLSRVYDNSFRYISNQMVSVEDIIKIRETWGNMGRRWYFEGDEVYALVRLTNLSYLPIERYFSLSLKNPPEKLHRTLEQEETEEYFKPQDSRGILAKYGAYILVAVVVCVALFLWGASVLQGH
jgi:hypothetical protein